MWLMRRMRRMRLKRLSDLKCLMGPMRLVRLLRLESLVALVPLVPLVHRGRRDVPWCRPRCGMEPVHLAAGRAQRGGHRLQRQGDREDPGQQ